MIPLFSVTLPPPDAAEEIEIETRADSMQSRVWRFDDEYVLGTRLTVLVSARSVVLARAATNAARREIDRLNLVFNWRRNDSELSALNRSGTAVASSDLFAVIQLAETWRHIAHGAFDGRMGALLSHWASAVTPSRNAIELALTALRTSKVMLEPVTRRIELSPAISLSLDAIAKGYIVDAALNVARRTVPDIEGLAINIGGDIRCWGESPTGRGWRIGIPDPTNPADNAPVVDAVSLRNVAIATSGRGPRDYTGNGHRSTTISPLTGQPVREVISASVVASHSADADAIATACLVLSPHQSIALVDKFGAAARITDARGQVHISTAWPTMQLAATTSKKAELKKAEPKNGESEKPAAIKANASATHKLPPELRWPADWEIGINYIAPERQENERERDFRTPYMVVWITNEQNKPVATPVMVGRDPEWQRDNFIWWGSYEERAKQVVELRSQATALSGRYRIFWGGIDENWQPLPIGKYVLHLETSQERGKHSYRSVTLEIGRERFKKSLPSLPESGSIEITYGHYNDRFSYGE
jgi:thiamine biosynthesis lipoprotein